MPFELLVITPPERTAHELATLSALFAAGLALLHVRKPTWSRAELEAYLQAIPAQYHPRLVLHAHYELAQHYAVRGVHLTEMAQRQPSIGRLLRQLSGRSVSASLHSLAAVAQHRRRYDYVFLSPIFDSISKDNYASGFHLPEVQASLQRLAARPAHRPRVLALGGVTAENIALLQPVGFAGAAVLGTIWQSADPVAALRQLQNAIG